MQPKGRCWIGAWKDNALASTKIGGSIAVRRFSLIQMLLESGGLELLVGAPRVMIIPRYSG
jgi:hypothetical protein